MKTTPTGRILYGEPNRQNLLVRTLEGDAIKKAAHAWTFGEPKWERNARNEHPTRPILTDNDLPTGSVKPGQSE